jgi:hypothetical protein
MNKSLDFTAKTDDPSLILKIHLEGDKGSARWVKNGETIVRVFMHEEAVRLLRENYQGAQNCSIGSNLEGEEHVAKA